MTREEILNAAKECVLRDRNATHGEPEDNFRTIAELWEAYYGTKFDLHQVAVMMILVKVSRTITSPAQPDHWIDIAGYAACGGQVAPQIVEDKKAFDWCPKFPDHKHRWSNNGTYNECSCGSVQKIVTEWTEPDTKSTGSR